MQVHPKGLVTLAGFAVLLPCMGVRLGAVAVAAVVAFDALMFFVPLGLWSLRDLRRK